MKSLQEFYNDKDTKENVKMYLIEFLEGIAIKKAFAREDIAGVAEAKELIEKAFDNLDNLFSPKPKKIEPVNEAR